jgi:hypothetical protein
MENKLPPGLFLVLPPTDGHQSTYSGIPLNTLIVLPKTLRKHVPNNHLIKAISLIHTKRYAQAVAELHTIKELSSSDAPELTALKKELEVALALSDDQQEKIWEITDLIGLENICFLLLHEPLKTILATPPNTQLALCCSTTYLVYSCWRHAQRKNHLDVLNTYLSNATIVPPMYTLLLPRPAIAMRANTPSLPKSILGEFMLESDPKKDYAGCRIRTHT